MNRNIIKYILLSVFLPAAANAGAQDMKKPGIGDDLSTAAISSVSGDELYGIPAANLSNTMVSPISGLTLMQGTGQVGGDTANWLIRGVGSYGSGNFKSAAIFVDGFEVTEEYFVSMSPAEIDRIEILKDAAALAIYGDKADNGVILVTTKRGEAGKPKINARVRYGVQSPTAVNKPLGAYDYARLYNQAVSNDAGQWAPAYQDYQLEDIKNGYTPDVDWFDEVMRDYGSYVDGNVIFSGGNKSARYNLTFGYLNNQGLLDVRNTDNTKNLSYQRYNLRANLDFDILNFMEAKIDIGGRLEYKRRPNYDIGSLFYNMARIPAISYDIWDNEEKTDWSGTAIYPDNPVASINSLGWYENKYRMLQGNFVLKERLDFLLKGLYIEESFSFFSLTTSSYSKTRDYARYHLGVQTTVNQNTSITASGYGSDSMKDWKQGKVGLGYKGEFGDHAVSASVNAHISSFQGDTYFEYKNHYVNFYGLFDYNYAGKYVAAFAFSVFGNDAYAPGHRYHFYPSVSGAWIMSREDWMKQVSWVDFLKLRASVGLTGNSYSMETSALSAFNFDSHGRYLYNRYYTTGTTGSFFMGPNSTWQSTLVPAFIENDRVAPEKSLKANIGIDAQLFSGLSVSVDAFLDKRYGILTVDNSRMNYYGKLVYLSNIGRMTNAGFEVSATYTGKAGDFSYAVAGAVSYARNRIDYMAEVKPANDFSAQTGLPYGTYIGLVADGFYDIDDFNPDGSLADGLPEPVFGAVQPGDVKYKDLDGNNIVDQNDVRKIGKSWVPELTASLGAKFMFKGFDFSFLFQGIGCVSYNLLDNQQTTAFVNNANVFSIADNAWAYYPEQGIDNRAGATYPRLTTQNNENNYQTSSLWVVDAGYIKLRNVELGYQFRKGPRLYVSGQNLLTFSPLLSKYNLDPESPDGYYPALKSITAGITITF